MNAQEIHNDRADDDIANTSR